MIECFQKGAMNPGNRENNRAKEECRCRGSFVTAPQMREFLVSVFKFTSTRFIGKFGAADYTKRLMKKLVRETIVKQLSTYYLRTFGFVKLNYPRNYGRLNRTRLAVC